jgi:hypothetical protein
VPPSWTLLIFSWMLCSTHWLKPLTLDLCFILSLCLLYTNATTSTSKSLRISLAFSTLSLLLRQLFIPLTFS